MTVTVRPPLYFSWPLQKKWPGDDFIFPLVHTLPTATPAIQLPVALRESPPLTPKVTVHDRPHRFNVVTYPLHNWNEVMLPPKKWFDHFTISEVAYLPTRAAATRNLYDSDWPRPKYPPHFSVGRRGQDLPKLSGVIDFDHGVPPKKLPPPIPVRVLNTPMTAPVPTALAQLETEFEPWGMPPKKYPEIHPNPNVAVLPQTPTTPPVVTYDYPSKITIRWPEDAVLPTAAALPPLIAIYQQPTEYDPQGRVPIKWAQDAPPPNVSLNPVGAVVPPIKNYDYPAKPRQYFTEEAASPNIPIQPSITNSQTFRGPIFQNPILKYQAIDASPPNILTLPNLAILITNYDYPQKTAPRYQDPWIPPNVAQLVPPNPQLPAPTFTFELGKLPLSTLDDFLPQFPLYVQPVPIYVPVIGFEIYIPYRTFTLATPVRTFSLTILYRTFTLQKTMQTFDVKDPAENWPLTFNFGPDLFNGETLAGAPTVSVVLNEGADPTPSAILAAPAGFDSSTTMVIQPVTGGVNGAEYQVIVTCPTTNPQKVLTLVGILPVRRS